MPAYGTYCESGGFSGGVAQQKGAQLPCHSLLTVQFKGASTQKSLTSCQAETILNMSYGSAKPSLVRFVHLRSNRKSEAPPAMFVMFDLRCGRPWINSMEYSTRSFGSNTACLRVSWRSRFPHAYRGSLRGFPMEDDLRVWKLLIVGVLDELSVATLLIFVAAPKPLCLFIFLVELGVVVDIPKLRVHGFLQM